MSQLLASSGQNNQDQKVQVLGPRPPWKAKTVWLAMVFVVIGSILWVGEEKKPTSTAGAQSGAAPGVSSFAQPSVSGETDAPAEPLKPTSPATFRLGVSYLGGFFLGWLFRRFLKMALLLAGGVTLLVGAGNYLGWVDLDWAALEGHVRHSLSWLHGEASAFNDFLTGYLPSAGTAAVGAVLGFWRK